MDSDEENDPRAHSTPKRDHTDTPQGNDASECQNKVRYVPGLDQTGESTRSLLSVLSHSSVENASKDSYSSSSNSSSSSSQLSSRKRRSKSPPSSTASHSKSQMRSSQSSSRDRSASVTSQSDSRRRSASSASSQSKWRSRSASASATSQSSSRTAPVRIASSSSSKTVTESPSDPQLTSWEKWLVQKTEEERKRVKRQVRREREERRKQEEAERAKKDRETVIKARVNEWIEDKNVKQKERVKRKDRLEQRNQHKKEEEQKQIIERAKSNRQQWLTDKKKKEQDEKAKEKEDQTRAAEEEEERKLKAGEAYSRWRQEASKKPMPIPNSFGICQGKIKGHDSAAYPIPNFYNPIPWMPIQLPKPTEGRGKKGGGLRKGPGDKSSKKAEVILQVLSPPLLYKDRETEAKCTRWGRPR